MKPGARALCAVLTFCAALSACAEDEFAPLNELGDRVRVLGVRADDPRPLPGQEVTLEALAFAPQGRDVALTWSWCPVFQETLEGFTCLTTQEDFAQAVGAQVPDFALGQGASVSWRQAIPQEVLAASCRGEGPLRLPSCDQGIPVLFQVEADDGVSREVAFKTLLLRVDEQVEGNQNPTFSGQLQVQGEPAPLEAGDLLTVEAGARVELEAALSPEAAELYRPPVVAPGQPEQAREQLTLTWFVQGGSTERTRTAWIAAEGALEDLTTNTWSAPSERGAASLHLVLRDGRGGLSWHSYPVQVR